MTDVLEIVLAKLNKLESSNASMREDVAAMRAQLTEALERQKEQSGDIQSLKLWRSMLVGVWAATTFIGGAFAWAANFQPMWRR